MRKMKIINDQSNKSPNVYSRYQLLFMAITASCSLVGIIFTYITVRNSINNSIEQREANRPYISIGANTCEIIPPDKYRFTSFFKNIGIRPARNIKRIIYSIPSLDGNPRIETNIATIVNELPKDVSLSSVMTLISKSSITSLYAVYKLEYDDAIFNKSYMQVYFWKLRFADQMKEGCFEIISEQEKVALINGPLKNIAFEN